MIQHTFDYINIYLKLSGPVKTDKHQKKLIVTTKPNDCQVRYNRNLELQSNSVISYNKEIISNFSVQNDYLFRNINVHGDNELMVITNRLLWSQRFHNNQV